MRRQIANFCGQSIHPLFSGAQHIGAWAATNYERVAGIERGGSMPEGQHRRRYRQRRHPDDRERSVAGGDHQSNSDGTVDPLTSRHAGG